MHSNENRVSELADAWRTNMLDTFPPRRGGQLQSCCDDRTLQVLEQFRLIERQEPLLLSREEQDKNNPDSVWNGVEAAVGIITLSLVLAAYSEGECVSFLVGS
jgi:hypothetical protein